MVSPYFKIVFIKNSLILSNLASLYQIVVHTPLGALIFPVFSVKKLIGLVKDAKMCYLFYNLKIWG